MKTFLGFNKHRRHSGHQRNPQPNQDILNPIKIEPKTIIQKPQDVELVSFDSLYQKHWFSRELEILATCSNSLSARNARLDMTHMELRRQLVQMKCAIKQNQNLDLGKIKAKIDKDLLDIRRNKHLKNLSKRKKLCSKNQNVQPNNVISIPGENPLPRNCSICLNLPALPCTKYCASHIMSNSEQVLFDYCTAKFSDNTQCSRPVFDVAHELPLCAEHARKRDNYDKMVAEIKPKKHSQSSKEGQQKIGAEKSETTSRKRVS